MMTKKSETISKIFKSVELLLLDVDGVLTRGEIIYDNHANEFKVFNVADGLGVFLLSKVKIPVIIITAKDSAVVRRRAKDMHIREVYAGILPKEKVLAQILSQYSVKAKNTCFVADDLLDLGLMQQVGIPVAVKNAPLEVKKAARYITSRNGGEGAVREVVELILKSKNIWKRVVRSLQLPDSK